MRDILLYTGSTGIAFWGVMHIVKTRAVLAGFEPLSHDNRLVLTMEWILEGVTLCFVAALVAAVTLLAGSANSVATLVYRASALMMIVMAGVSLFTGARASPLPYKLCPPIFTSVAVLYLVASMLRS
ncbi:MAG: hypothetical protein JSV86_10170 [Gemmatimonadota bacterium]|nr:MAG: hypothetical protein JSV86_10170 [Gemmatimonadota bacterium]